MLIAFNIEAQIYTVGESYYSENEYAEYIHGNLPIILSAPHGGEKRPEDIPDRQCPGCVYVNDTNTQELAREVAAEIQILTNCQPYLIISRLHRSKLDANREIVEAADGDPQSETAWMFYHEHAAFAQDNIEADFGAGLFIDLHGHGHQIQRLELGYLMSRSSLENLNNDLEEKYDNSSIRNLVENNLLDLSFVELLQGNQSLGEMMEERDVDAVPSESDPYPQSGESFFSGGYNTRSYGSLNSGTIDAIQIECHRDVRFDDVPRKEFANHLAHAIVEYLQIHYFENFGMGFCNTVSTSNPNSSFRVYPNPTLSNLHINLASHSVQQFQIINSLGQVVLEGKGQLDFGSINVSALSQGFYILNLLDNNEVLHSTSFIKN